MSADYTGKTEINLSEREETDELIAIVASPLDTLIKEIENNPNLPLSVPSNLINPDKLIVKAKESLTKKEPHYNRWEYSQNLSINVATENINRALCFMDGFIKLLNARGHNLIVNNEGTFAIVDNEKLKVRLREKNKRVIVKGKYSWDNSEYHPTGILILGISEVSWREIEWKDGKAPIEKQLSKILAKLEMESIQIKEDRIQSEKGRAEQQERDRIRQELEKRKQQELSNFKALLMNADRWGQSMMMNNYINSIESDALLNNSLPDDLKDWIAWARKKVDWYNPLVDAKDELLDDKDKEKINALNVPSPSINNFYHDSGHSFYTGFPYWLK